MDLKQAWKEDWQQDLRRTVAVAVVLGLLASGSILLLANGKNFLIALKPIYDMNYVLDHGAKKGMHISGEIAFVYDCFAEMENTGSNKVTAYYYAIPAGEGMMILYVAAGKREAAETLFAETLEYLETGAPPASVIPIEGYVVKAEGRLPYLLSEYMKEIGYSEEEITAMGETLMLRDAAGSLKAARIYAPIGMILLALGILATAFAILRGRFRQAGQM